jgi:hypothetical protein
VISVELPSILKAVQGGEELDWAVLYFYGTWEENPEHTDPILEDDIDGLDAPLMLSWKELKALAETFTEIVDITVIGCIDAKNLRRYKRSQDMVHNCDILIQLVDSNFWEIFCVDKELISRLKDKFSDVKLITVADLPDQ